MNHKRLLLSVLIGFFANTLSGQDTDATSQPKRGQIPVKVKVDNPFETDFAARDEMGMMDMGMDMGMDMDADMDADMDMEMGMGMGMGMDMGGGMGMEAQVELSEDELFGKRMEMAIHRMRSSKTEAEKSQLMIYTEAALRDRYARMIQKRQAEIERLKASIASLESDLERRATAIDRVVKLQMQSAVLAAEGLLELNTLPKQPAPQNEGGMF